MRRASGVETGRSRRSGSANPVSRSHGDWGCADGRACRPRPRRPRGVPSGLRRQERRRSRSQFGMSARGSGPEAGAMWTHVARPAFAVPPERQSRAASSARWQWIIATRTTTTRCGAEDFTPPSAVQLRRGTPLRTVRPGGRGSPLPCSAVASAAASPRLFTATVQPRTGCSGSSVPVVEDVASERCALKAPRRSSRPGLWDIHLALFRTKQNIA